MRFYQLFAVLVLVPLAELALLLWIGHLTDWKVSLLIVIGTGLIGSFLARSQGMQVMRRVHGEISEGRMPADALLDGLLILAAGLLLLTPGLITDLAGLLLLVPVSRRYFKRMIAARLRRRFERSFGTVARSRVIDAYVIPPSDSEPR